jgi:addiction module HigA family antidote
MPSLDAITRRRRRGRRAHAPVHPGEILSEEFLAPLELSAQDLADGIHFPLRRVREIMRGARPISAEVALRLARYFGTSEEFWMNLQVHHDLELERDRLGARVRKEVAVLKRAS